MSENSLRKKSDVIFYQILGLGLSFSALFLFLSIKLYSKLNLIWNSFLGRLEAICGCTNHLSFANHPFIFSSLSLIGLMFAIFFVLMMVKTVKLYSSNHRFIKANLRNKKQNVSLKLKEVSLPLKLKNRIVEIQNEQPVIFCFGFLRPKICISSKLVKKLSRTELRAVLLHERYHLLAYGPAKLFIVKIIEKIFFFAPKIKLLTKQYLISSELIADEQAINDFHNKTPLIKALYKTIRWQERMMMGNNLVVSFSDAIDERINNLVYEDYAPKFKFFVPQLFLRFFIVIFIFILITIFINFNKSVLASHNFNACPAMRSGASEIDDQCEFAHGESTCQMKYDIKDNSCKTTKPNN